MNPKRPLDGVQLHVRTGSRLHFGLMELCRSEVGCFSGLGLMLKTPGYLLHLRGECSRLPAVQARDEEQRNRIANVTRTWRRTNPKSRMPAEIVVEEWLPLHAGLGAGTQLACAVAGALELFGQPKALDVGWCCCSRVLQDAVWLSGASGRGLRSGIGLQGFLFGGLILDQGYAESRCESPSGEPRQVLAESVYLNPEWRVLLILPQRLDHVIAGEAESSMMNSLGKAPNRHREEMLAVARRACLAIQGGESCQSFTALLDEYMHFAGQLFTAMQGGMYRSPRVENIVAFAREVGLLGVGQSSWGPTVFGFCENAANAEHYAQVLRESPHLAEHRIAVCEPASHGADYRWVKG